MVITRFFTRSFLHVLAIMICSWVAKAQFSGSWIDRSPLDGGRLSSIVASPTNPDVLLVASPGGGLWRTVNNGRNWVQPVGYALSDFTILDLQWDILNPNRLLALTYSDVYATTDLGDTWVNLTGNGGYPAGKPLELRQISDPKPMAQLRTSPTSRILFAALPGSGLLYATDGTHFLQHWPFPGGASNPDNHITSIATDPETGYVYFSTMGVRFGTDSVGRAHVFRSRFPWTQSNPGLTWNYANIGLPSGVLVKCIAYGGQSNNLVVAISNATSGTEVYTTSTGYIWEATAPFPLVSHDARPLFAPTYNQLLVGTVLLYSSNNRGASWQHLGAGLDLHPDIRALYYQDYASGESYLWATTDGSVSNTVNIIRFSYSPGSMPRSPTIIPVLGINGAQAFYCAVAGRPGTPRRRMFLGLMDNNGICSDDNGGSWSPMGTPPSLGGGDYTSLVFAPSNMDRAYSRTIGNGFSRTNNAFSAIRKNDVDWTRFPDTIRNVPEIWTNAMTAVDPSNPDRVCFAHLLDIGYSSDGGAHIAYFTLPGGARPISVLLDYGGNLFVGTKDNGVFASYDNGLNWIPFALNMPAPKAILKMIHSPAGGTGGTFYFATTSGLYRKTTTGETTLVSADPAYIVTDVEYDPACPQRVYASFGFAGSTMMHRGGIIASNDNGNTFTSITSGHKIHQCPITDIQVDPADSRYLHAATYGLGAWTFDMGSPPPCR